MVNNLPCKRFPRRLPENAAYRRTEDSSKVSPASEGPGIGRLKTGLTESGDLLQDLLQVVENLHGVRAQHKGSLADRSRRPRCHLPKAFKIRVQEVILPLFPSPQPKETEEYFFLQVDLGNLRETVTIAF